MLRRGESGDVSGHHVTVSCREKGQIEMPEFMQEWWFLALMFVLLLALVGLLLFLRNRRPED